MDKCNEASEENIVYDWAYSKGIVPKKYKGENIYDPNCHKLVKLANELTESCFGKVLMEDVYKTRIAAFEQTYRSLPHGKNGEKNLSVTTKAHCIFEHVVQNFKKDWSFFRCVV